MKKPGRTSPMRLACWDLIGGLLVLSAFVQEFVYVLLGNHRDWSGKWIWLGPFVLGMGIIFIAERQLQNEIWTDEELGPLRRLLDPPAWKMLPFIPIVALLTMLSIQRLERHMAVWVFLMLPFQMAMRLQQIVKPKVSSERLLAWAVDGFQPRDAILHEPALFRAAGR
jgi:hypothetical protein